MLLAAARDEWFALDGDWREAFSHHPKIGDRDALRQRFAATAHLSEREQQGVAGAAEACSRRSPTATPLRAHVRLHLHRLRDRRTADEMLALLRARLGNDPDTEIRSPPRSRRRSRRCD